MTRLFFLVVNTFQNQIESSYQGKSILTNLVTQNKFLGWTRLTVIAIAIGTFLWSFYPKYEGI